MIKITEILLLAAALLTASSTAAAAALQLFSPAFKDGGNIPAVYARPAAGGDNVSIPLKWNGAPEGTRSFALTIVDQHPVAKKWVHWMVIDIPPQVTSLAEGASGKNMPPGATEMKNSFGDIGYGGPQPPKGTGRHPYLITVYALKDPGLNLKTNQSLSDFRNATNGKVLGEVTITGFFER